VRTDFTDIESVSTDPYIGGTRKPRTKTHGPKSYGRWSTHQRRRKAVTKKKKRRPWTDHHRDRGRLATLGDTRSKNKEQRTKKTKERRRKSVVRGTWIKIMILYFKNKKGAEAPLGGSWLTPT